MITYQIENDLTAEEFKALLIQSTLNERRPQELKRLEAMVKNANLIVTARLNNQLIGVARSVTDFVYCTYLSDLAVDKSFQKQGIGKALIQRTKNETPEAMVILLAAPKAINYYPHIGMEKHNGCFLLKAENNLK